MFITSVSSKKVKNVSAHDYNVESIFGDKLQVEQHVQFITGHVDDVITNKKHPLFIRMGQNDRYINGRRRSCTRRN